MTVTKQQQLEWLANKIVKWPADGERIPVVVDDSGNPKFYMPWDAFATWDTRRVDFTREEWQQERDKMQNKPSWSSAPRWAEFLAQSPSGSWEWYSGKPSAGALFWEHVDAGIHGETAENHGGKILGDWRDTLDARPKVTISNQTSATISATKTGDSEMTITAQDNSWHDRGEFPPFDAAIEWDAWGDGNWVETKIVADAGDGDFVMIVKGVKTIVGMPVNFRPLRTEREKAIDEMVKTFEPHYGSGVVARKHAGIAELLYDAGYRKEQPK